LRGDFGPAIGADDPARVVLCERRLGGHRVLLVAVSDEADLRSPCAVAPRDGRLRAVRSDYTIHSVCWEGIRKWLEPSSVRRFGRTWRSSVWARTVDPRRGGARPLR